MNCQGLLKQMGGLGLFVLLLVGCSAPTAKPVQPTATLAPPTTTPFPPTRTPIPPTVTPSPTAVPTLPSRDPLPLAPLSREFRDLAGAVPRVICLDLKEDYPGMQSPPERDVKSELKRFFALNGVSLLEPGDACDTRMELSIIGQALSAKYGENTTCFTGASTRGKLTLTLSDGRQATQMIDAKESPPMMVTKCPKDASGAPLGWTTAVGITEALAQIWGFELLTAPFQYGNTNFAAILYANAAAEVCLNHWNDPFIEKETVVNCMVEVATMQNSRQTQALSTLAGFKSKALPAVPRLIELLQKYEIATPMPIYFTTADQLTEKVIETLKAITGQDFGKDPAAWQQWWESQP